MELLECSFPRLDIYISRCILFPTFCPKLPTTIDEMKGGRFGKVTSKMNVPREEFKGVSCALQFPFFPTPLAPSLFL